MKQITTILLAYFLFTVCGSGSGGAQKAEILWDKYGVPHIYGKSNQEVYYALGWAEMKSHADLILRLYAISRGRAAEYFGKDYIDSDSRILLFGLPDLAGKGYKNQDPEFKGYLDAFVKGMNDYADSHKQTIAEKVRPVLPVTPEDILAHTIRVINLEFLAGEDINAAAREMAPGSNSLAIAPSRSQSGKAMLISNPHLPWNDFFLWFEAHLNAPDMHTYGVALVGMPVLTIAFNDYLGWTHTVNTIDASDRYALSLKDGGYLLDGKIMQFEKKDVIIKVREDNGSLTMKKLTFRYSAHGPVVGEKGDMAFAIRIAGMENYDMIKQYHKMCVSRNLREFESALAMLQNPMFNVVYADKEGNILYLFNGNVPVRQEGDFAFWHGTIDGTMSKYIWNKTHPYNDLPRVLNPEGGFLQNCNDPPWFCTWPAALDNSAFPKYMSPQGVGWRAQRTMHMVKDKKTLTFDELVGIKLNTELEVADRFLPDLLAAAEEFPGKDVDEAAAVLKKWDRKADSGSRGAVLFGTWWESVRPDIFSRQWSKAEPLTTPAGLKDKKKAVELLAAAARSMKENFGTLDIPLGEVYRFRIGKYDYPANGGPDHFGVFRAMYYAPDKDKKWRAVAGDTYVAVTEFGDKPKAMVLLSYGNATQPGNKHVGDQLEMLSAKQLRPALLSREEIMKNLESDETLLIK
jgi:acyl-homoserine-lactone acylase